MPSTFGPGKDWYVELDAADSFPYLPPAVHLSICAASAPPLLQARRAPASVFELAWKPVEIRFTKDGQCPKSLARQIVRTEGLTRCVNFPITETAEWIEKERARRARQRPPKPTRQKFKLKGSVEWVHGRN